MPQSTSGLFRLAIGACPACSVYTASFFAGRSVIYRRSNRSVTMRCETCGLQWTMTYVQINKAMRRQQAMDDGGTPASVVYEQMTNATDFAVENETRGSTATKDSPIPK
jgi:hypothetical protein